MKNKKFGGDKLARSDFQKFLFCFGIFVGIMFVLATIVNSTSGDTIEDKFDEDYQDSLRVADSLRIPNGDSTLYKSYDASEKIILIEDDGYDDVVKLKLLSNYNQHVGVGQDIKVAEFQLIDYRGEDLFDSLEFYNIGEGYEKEIKQFRLKYATDYLEAVCYDKEIFDSQTNESLGSEEVCYDQQRTSWTEFDSLSSIPNKNIRVGLFTDTVLGEHVEWVPMVRGFECLEWASYLADGLVGYWKLDEISGTNAEDSHGANNGTANSLYVFNGSASGKIETCADFTSGDYSIESANNVGITGASNRSISFWAKFPNTNVEDSWREIFYFGTGANSQYFSLIIKETTNEIWFSGWNDNSNTGFTKHTNWRHYVVTYDGTNVKVYQNAGTPATNAHTLNTGASHLFLGRGSSLYLNVYIDEFGIWDRVLNSTEVATLYNSDSGLAYP